MFWLTRGPAAGRRAVAVDIARRVLLDLASRTTEAVLAMAEDLQQIGVADNGVPYLVTVWLIVGPDDTRWITMEVGIPSRWRCNRRLIRTAEVRPGQQDWSTLNIGRGRRWP